jgi:adenylate cyclase
MSRRVRSLAHAGLVTLARPWGAYVTPTTTALKVTLVLVLVGALVVSATATVMTPLSHALAAAAFEWTRLRALLQRFLARDVDELSTTAANADPGLEGKRVQATIVVCDLRDFTAFAELRPAEQVSHVCDRYLTEMSEAIRAHGGTLLDYRGDGIIAAFGAAAEQSDHADRALHAVREMAGPRLANLNAWLRAENVGKRFRIGIGVSSGEVMFGNVGSDWRLEYTATGDTVNAAVRLAAMIENSQNQVLVSETTRAMLRHEAPDLQYFDATRTRAKPIKSKLWTLDPGAAQVSTARDVHPQRRSSRRET